jgi:hypothetical protein
MAAPPLPPCNPTTSRVVQLVLKGSMSPGGSNATPSGQVFYYRQSIIGGPLLFSQVSAAFQTAVVVPLLAAANAAYSPNLVQIRLVNDPTLPVQAFAAPGVGAIATDSEPSDDAVVVVLKTAWRGKRGRGFKHFGGTNEVDTLRDVLVGAGLARWQAVRDACKTAFADAGGSTWVPFVFSTYQSVYMSLPTTIRGNDVTGADLDLVIGTMRRRKAAKVI